MIVDDRLGTYADVALAAPRHMATMAAVRGLVAELHPDVVEVASQREGSVWWGWRGDKMRQGYAYVMPHPEHVDLGFFQGVSLPDPAGLLRGTGRRLRHVRLRTPAEATRPAVRALMIAARDERQTAVLT